VKSARRGASQNACTARSPGGTMSDHTDDAATIQALLERLVKFRLPRTLAIQKRVDNGECLTDEDIAFLKSAMEDAQDGQKFVARNPQFHTLGTQIAQLYGDIVRKALENEENKKGA
jgi:hypothetical protein